MRELANALERAAILADGDAIEPAHDLAAAPGCPRPAGAAARPDGTLAELEREAIPGAAERGGNRKRAAERLGIGLRTLYDKLKRYRLN